MPKITTLVKILRDGTRKGNFFSTLNEEHGNPLLAFRDHYARLELFWKKELPKHDKTFVDSNVAGLAIGADRDSVLGIVDTMTREFIVFWMPELEIFIDESRYEIRNKNLYKKMVLGIEDNIIAIANGLDCTQDKTADTLRRALLTLTISYLTNLLAIYGESLDQEEKARYDPRKYLSTTEAAISTVEVDSRIEPMSEARLLNSAIAWDVSDKHETYHAIHLKPPRSPTKRRFSTAFSIDESDPADNGSVWDTHQTVKRQKFEVKISQVINVSDGEEVEVYENTTTRETRRVLKPTSRSNKEKSSLPKSGKVSSTIVDAQREVEIPGTLKTTDENCALM